MTASKAYTKQLAAWRRGKEDAERAMSGEDLALAIDARWQAARAMLAALQAYKTVWGSLPVPMCQQIEAAIAQAEAAGISPDKGA